MKTLFSEGLVQKFANSIGPRGIRFGGISYSGQVELKLLKIDRELLAG